MKNYKPFYEAETVRLFKETIQSPSTPPPSIPPVKILLRLWGKSFLRGIYRNIETFAFKVLQ